MDYGRRSHDLGESYMRSAAMKYLMMCVGSLFADDVDVRADTTLVTADGKK